MLQTAVTICYSLPQPAKSIVQISRPHKSQGHKPLLATSFIIHSKEAAGYRIHQWDHAAQPGVTTWGNFAPTPPLNAGSHDLSTANEFLNITDHRGVDPGRLRGS